MGGNRAQFAWYGAQEGDNKLAIHRQDQQSQVVAATLEILAQVSCQKPWTAAVIYFIQR